MMRLLIPISFGLSLAACGTANAGDQGSRSSHYAVTAVGRIDSKGESRNLVAAADGVIDRVLVRRGVQVEAGQLLVLIRCQERWAAAAAREVDASRASADAATIMDGARQEEVAAARARLAAAQASANNERQRLDQAAALVGRGFVSRRELEARTNSSMAADATMAAAHASLDQLVNGPRVSERKSAMAAAMAASADARAAAARAQDCELRSPIGGQVLQVLRREGEFSGATQGTTLVVVGDTTQLFVRAEVGERDIGQLRIGQRADIWTDEASNVWHGRVTEMANVMGRRSARSLDPTDRFDRDVREVFLTIEGAAPTLPVGLRTTVGFHR